MLLTKDQLQHFDENGYLLRKKVFSIDEIGSISDAFGRLQEIALDLEDSCDKNGAHFVVEKKKIHRIVWAGGAEPALLNISEDPRLTVPVAQMLGSIAMDQLICQAHYKLPGDKVSFPLHQDSENRGYGTEDWKDVNGSGSYIQTVVAIDPMDRGNSPLIIEPGSHKQGHLELDKELNRIAYVRSHHFEQLKMDPGDVLYFGPYFVHGSGVNRSNRSRRIFINGYAYPGANKRKYPGEGSGRRITLAQVWQEKIREARDLAA